MGSVFKYITAAVAFLALSDSAAAREVRNINGGWTLFTSTDASTDGAATVNLPHTQTAAEATSYLRDLEPQPSWKGKRVFLRVGGAARVADLFVGGVHVAAHRGGNSAFTVEITDRLSWDTPTPVRIEVNSSPGLEVMPTAGREKIYGGVFRGVDLIVCDSLSVSPAAAPRQMSPAAADADDAARGAGAPDTTTRITGGGDGVWITTDRLSAERAEGRVRLALLAPETLPAEAFARVRFTDAEGSVVAQSVAPVVAGGGEIEIPFTLSHPHLWQGVEDPYLYDVEVALIGADGAATDTVTIPTGFRTVGVDSSNSVTLNGRPIRIRGVILGRDRMIVGTALTPFQIEEDVDFILEMGANAVRVAGGQHSDYFYTLCDEAGLIVWNDSPFTGAAYPTDIDFTGTARLGENGREQLSEMIAQLYNHPSVVAWGLFSNVSTRTPTSPIPYVRSLAALSKSLDAGRLTAASSVSDGEVNLITDIVSFDLSLGWESGLPDAVVPWLEQLRGGWPDLRAGISYSAGGSIFNQTERLERPSPSGGFHPEGWQTFFHDQYMLHAVDAPGLWGVFVGNMFDSGAAKSTGAAALSPAGTPAAGGAIDDLGLVTFDRKDRKDAFWIYKANWNPQDPFVRIAGSRLDNRAERRQTIVVYSNQGEVELLVNGRSQGTRTAARGTFVWEGVVMRTGANRMEARAAGGYAHRTSINISSTAAAVTNAPQPTSATSSTIAVGL